MAVVIRLQGLPAVAGSVDIRHFFTGLQIPDGGVHIIGGKLGEAFIIFATDEGARRAMSRSGGFIKTSQIQLFLSSRTEMQQTLEASRKNKNPKHPAVPPAGEANRPATVKKGANPSKFEKKNYDADFDNSGGKQYPQNYDKREANTSKDDLYLFLYGLPYNVTEDEIRHFFKDLDVADILFILRANGLKNGNAMVRFGSVKDAEAAMAFNNEYIGSRFISLKKTTEEKWVAAGGKVGQAHTKQPRKRTRSRSPQNQQFYLHLKNLSYGVDKNDIRLFFALPDMADSEIKFLLDKHNNRTREGFIMLKKEWQYEKCLSLNKNHLKGRPLFILPIARKAMLDLIESYETQAVPKQEHAYEDHPRREPSNPKRCIYVRNFPFDVSKAEVQKFFSGFPVHEDDLFLLFDNKGVGLGEALVRFPSEEQALLAEGLNRQLFLGTEVLLRRITDEQMKEFGAFIDTPARNDYIKVPLPESHVRPYGFPEYDRRGFRGSPERLHDPYPMEYGGGYEMENNHAEYDHSLSEPHGNRAAGAVIRMMNLPYSITNEEILDFFHGYNVIPDSVDIKFNRKGMATGHATICTGNYEEGLAAVDELSERPIGTRKIILNLTRI